MRASVAVAASGAVLGLIGAGLLLGGVTALSTEPSPITGILLIVVGVMALADGGRRWNVDYPRAKFRERVRAMGDPTGLTLGDVRRAIGRERDLENTETGTQLTWRVGKLALTLAFDAGRICTGIVAARGLSGTR